MSKRWHLPAYAGFIFAYVVLAAPTAALTVTRDVDFEALNQNPFLSGPAFDQFLPTQSISLPTVREDFPALTIPITPLTFFQFGARVEGDLALDFWTGIDSGRLNISYPVHTALDVPDSVSAGATFSLGSSASVLPGGIPYVVAAIKGGAQHGTISNAYLDLISGTTGAPSLTTTNPGITAGVDLRVTNHNSVNLQGCAETVILGTQCLDIVDADLPSLGTQTITLVSASTAGNVKILPDVPGASITKSLPVTIPIGGVPPDATFTVSKPDLSQSGNLSGSALVASKTSSVATLGVDIDQLISNVALNPLGLPPLTGSIGPVGYSLLNANASLSGGLYQDLTLTGKTKVTLALDHTVRARVNGVDLGAVKVFSFIAGDDVKISPMGFLTKLHAVPTFSFDNQLVNSTGVSLNAEIDGDALSAQVPIIGTVGPLVPHGEADVNLGKFEVYGNSFGVDMKSIVGKGFDVDFGLNPGTVGLKATPTLLSEDGDGNARFHFDITRNGVTIDSFDIAGRIQRTSLCANCDIVTSYFLPNLEPDDDLTISVDGNTVNLGDIFCLSGQCDQTFDLSSLEDLAQGITAPGFDPVYFADSLPDFQLSDPVLSEDFVDHTGSTPDPGVVRTLDMALYDELIGVPEPGTLPVLMIGLLGMMLLSGRVRARRPRHKGSFPCAA